MASAHDLIQRLRWRDVRYGFATPREFEERRKESWLAPNTRNHRVVPGGISREEYNVSGDITAEDDTAEAFASLVLGRTIVGFHREPSSGEDWPQGANPVTLTLDDGSRLLFTSWGYDADGVNTVYAVPPNGTNRG